MLGIGGVALALAAVRVIADHSSPASWSQLRRWAASAQPGTLYRGNRELAAAGGTYWPAVHGQQQAIPFLFSDAPEYLHDDALGKGLAYRRLTTEARYRRESGARLPFGVGFHHINKTRDTVTGHPHAATLAIVVRLASSLREGAQTVRNSTPATVRLVHGAYGMEKGMAVFAGRQCALNWFDHPNVLPVTVTLRPGEARAIFHLRLPPETAVNGMFDLEATNAYFVQVYVVFGEVPDYARIRFAPYDNTIGTNCGAGRYWKRTLQPAAGTPAFDAADTRHANKVHFRFYDHLKKISDSVDMQYLVDDTWEQRPEGPGKALVLQKGGKRRPFKGDYNVEYTITLPIKSGTGKPAWLALVDTQRFGMFAGAAKMADGTTVAIPRGNRALVRADGAGEGVLLARVCVSSRAPTPYTFHWMLPGGSYGDQEFMLIPLGSDVVTQ